MTTKPNDVRVSRELRSALAMVLNALDRDAEEGEAARGEMAAELRALLAQPADQQGEPVYQCRYPGGGWVDIREDQQEWASSLPHTELRTLYRLAQPDTAKVDERLVEATAFVQKLRDAAAGQPSFATGYLSDILDVLQGRAKLNTPQ